MSKRARDYRAWLRSDEYHKHFLSTIQCGMGWLEERKKLRQTVSKLIDELREAERKLECMKKELEDSKKEGAMP